jgi:hypothetical protein
MTYTTACGSGRSLHNHLPVASRAALERMKSSHAVDRRDGSHDEVKNPSLGFVVGLAVGDGGLNRFGSGPLSPAHP